MPKMTIIITKTMPKMTTMTRKTIPTAAQQMANDGSGGSTDGNDGNNDKSIGA